MKVETGDIEVTKYFDYRGNIERRDYNWKGGPVCDISRDLLDMADEDCIEQKGNRLKIGPYKLYLVDHRPWEWYDRYIRVDWPFWWLLVLWNKSTKWFDKIYRRIVITAAVWGLAHYDPAKLPHWTDIYLFRKLLRGE